MHNLWKTSGAAAAAHIIGDAPPMDTVTARLTSMMLPVWEQPFSGRASRAYGLSTTTEVTHAHPPQFTLVVGPGVRTVSKTTRRGARVGRADPARSRRTPGAIEQFRRQIREWRTPRRRRGTCALRVSLSKAAEILFPVLPGVIAMCHGARDSVAATSQPKATQRTDPRRTDMCHAATANDQRRL